MNDIPKGLAYYQTSNREGQPLLPLRSALAIDIFSQVFGPEVFVVRPLEKESIKELLQECLEAADFLIASEATEPH